MTDKKHVNTKNPFGLKDKIGYLLGDLGNDFTFMFASFFLMIFYTKVLGLSGSLVGFVFLVSRIVDAFTDTAMGRLIDTLKPVKDGRFRPWIRRMSIPVVLTAILMFLYVVKDWSYVPKVIYVWVTYLLWGSVCYTAINIPYGSMAAALSTESEDRASLSTFRSLGSTMAQLIIGVVTPLFIYSKDAAGNEILVPQNFTILAVIYGAIAIICYLVCYKWCTERIHTPAKQVENNQKGNGKLLLKTLITNRALISIIGAALLLLLAMILGQTMNSYLFLDYFKNGKVLAVIGIINAVTMFMVAPFAPKLVKVLGKKEIAGFSVLLTSFVYFVLYFIKVESVTVFMVLFFVATIGVSMFNAIVWAFISDVIDYHEVKTHKREDGTIYAVYSFARKLGQALAGGIGGFALSAIGYVSEATVQTEVVAKNIYNISTIVPAIAYLGVALIMFFVYPLSKKRVEENTAELKRRRHSNI